MLAVLVSDQLRAVGPRHASETRQLPSKPCRPLSLYFTMPRIANPPRQREEKVPYEPLILILILIQPAVSTDLESLLVLMRHMQNEDPWFERFDETIVRKTSPSSSTTQFLHPEVNHGNSAIEVYRRRGFVDYQRSLTTKSLNG